MGKEIVYCGGCGKSLREEEFERGKAHTLDHRPYCIACKPLPAAPPTSAPSRPPPPPSSHRYRTLPAPGTTSRTILIAGCGLLVAALLLLLVFSGGKPDPVPPVPIDSRVAPSKLPPRPIDTPALKPAPPAVSLKDLEALAASPADPDAILQKCDELRASIKGTPDEARFATIERRALEARQTRELERKISRSIEQARKLIDDDRAVERQEEIHGFLKATREIAGERRAEVDRLAADFQKKLRDAATAPKPPPPSSPAAVVSFTLINADTDQPVAGFDPMPPNAVINLATVGTRNLNIRANPSTAKSGSIRFELNGRLYSIEDTAPYAIAGKVDANYRPWTPPPGTHTITATPFALAKAAGAAGTPLTLTFQVLDLSATGETFVFFQDGVSPTPQYNGTRDTEIDELHPENSAGAAKRLEAEGDLKGTGKDRYVLFLWDLSAIPAGSVVRSASVTFQVVGSGSKVPYGLHELKRGWAERGGCWAQAAPGKPWEIPGAKGPQDRGATMGSLLAPRTGPVTASLDVAIIQSWIDRPASNFGFVLANPDTSDALQVASREAVSAQDRPKLTVVWSK